MSLKKNNHMPPNEFNATNRITLGTFDELRICAEYLADPDAHEIEALSELELAAEVALLARATQTALGFDGAAQNLPCVAHRALDFDQLLWTAKALADPDALDVSLMNDEELGRELACADIAARSSAVGARAASTTQSVKQISRWVSVVSFHLRRRTHGAFTLAVNKLLGELACFRMGGALTVGRHLVFFVCAVAIFMQLGFLSWFTSVMLQREKPLVGVDSQSITSDLGHTSTVPSSIAEKELSGSGGTKIQEDHAPIMRPLDASSSRVGTFAAVAEDAQASTTADYSLTQSFDTSDRQANSDAGVATSLRGVAAPTITSNGWVALAVIGIFVTTIYMLILGALHLERRGAYRESDARQDIFGNDDIDPTDGDSQEMKVVIRRFRN